MAEKLIGEVSHWFGKPSVAGIELTDELKVGDTIHIQGHTSEFTHLVESMQIEHENVDTAGAGDSIGIKVAERARQHDKVYLVTDD